MFKLKCIQKEGRYQHKTNSTDSPKQGLPSLKNKALKLFRSKSYKQKFKVPHLVLFGKTLKGNIFKSVGPMQILMPEMKSVPSN